MERDARRGHAATTITDKDMLRKAPCVQDIIVVTVNGLEACTTFTTILFRNMPWDKALLGFVWSKYQEVPTIVSQGRLCLMSF